MNPFDDTAVPPRGPELDSGAPDSSPSGESTPPQANLPVSAPGPVPEPVSAQRIYPVDLQISWSWPHLIIFSFFGFISLLVIQGALIYFIPHPHLATKELEKYFISNPKFSIGSMLLWYAALFFFLYVTLSLLRGHSFWRSLGWRKIEPRSGELPKSPLIYFISGSGLSLLVAVLSTQMKTPENIPMEELFKNRETALLFMAMAVLVAPLVEETLFRGYLYPLFARSFGIGPGTILTGVLFGLMHGAQLGWTVGLVSILIFVGIVFTVVRARTGSVFASYLMHLGYNSLISFFAILGTHGFTKLPPGH